MYLLSVRNNKGLDCPDDLKPYYDTKKDARLAGMNYCKSGKAEWYKIIKLIQPAGHYRTVEYGNESGKTE